MQMLTPSAWQGADGSESVVSGVDGALTEPLISGSAPILWAGVSVFLLIFISVLMLIIRGRVVAPSRQGAAKQRRYFEPAGDSAQIAFDDEEAASPHNERAVASRREGAPLEDMGREDAERKETQRIVNHTGHHAQFDGRHSGDLNALEDEPAPAKQKKSAFAGLFAKKKDIRDHSPEPALEGFASQAEEIAPPISESQMASATEARLVEAEEAAHAALARARDAEALARDLARANENTERVIRLGLRENETTVSAMSERLTALADEFQTRFAAAQAAYDANARDAHGGLSEAHFEELANLMGEQFEHLRSTVDDAIKRLSHRVDALAATPRAPALTAARIQLADLLRDALPPQRFALSAKLASGRTADALITMPGDLAPVAIDARFPVEAFDDWRRARDIGGREEETETELRRAVLRHIADAGERLVIAGETADCALMFMPSELILAELHAYFPDLIQEAYRARIWIVGPTSLMATLHTIGAVSGYAHEKQAPTPITTQTRNGNGGHTDEFAGHSETDEEHTPAVREMKAKEPLPFPRPEALR